jgi:two-component system sensor histidine kinase PilS (NtrC family)
MFFQNIRGIDVKSLHGLMIFRLILVTLILGTVIVFLLGRQADFSLFPIYGLLVLTYVISIFYWLALKWEISPALLIYVQLSVDVVLVTGIIYYSGGSESILTLLYLMVIISASMFLRLGGILYITSLASAAYGLMSWLQYSGIVHTPSFFEPDRYPRSPEQSSINVFLNICFFYLVAVLSGFLAEKLRRKGEELETASQRLRRVQLDTDDILENIPSGLVTLDGEGRVQYFNGAAEKILGLTIQQVKGRPYDRVFGEQNRELMNVLRTAFEKAVVYERKELTATSPEGKSIPLGISTTLLGPVEGERSGVIAVFQNLTEAKQLEQRARQADRLAVLGQLSAAIAHEIRNPLATISGSVEVLRDTTQLTGEEKKLMDLVTHESDRLNKIITDFLLYARIRPAEMALVDVARAVEETLTLVRNHDDYRDDIELVDAIENEVVYALADGDQVKQIFLNIAINALQAMPQGGCLKVGLREEGGVKNNLQAEKEDMVKVYFHDTGMGIPTDELENIFEPFYSSKKDGTGLGLSIAQRIVENNGGKLEVESQEGKGTIFTVSLLAEQGYSGGEHETAKA